MMHQRHFDTSEVVHGTVYYSGIGPKNAAAELSQKEDMILEHRRSP
jgi:hypothetical protein